MSERLLTTEALAERQAIVDIIERHLDATTEDGEQGEVWIVRRILDEIRSERPRDLHARLSQSTEAGPASEAGLYQTAPSVSSQAGNDTQVARPATAQEAETGGWTAWHGYQEPVDPNAMVRVRFRDGKEEVDQGRLWDFEHFGDRDEDIVAYRVEPASPPDREGERR